MRWRLKGRRPEDRCPHVREPIYPDHIDRDLYDPVRPRLVERRGEVDVARRIIMIQDERIEYHWAQKDNLVVSETRSVPSTPSRRRAIIGSSRVAETFQAEVGLDQVAGGRDPVVPVVDHDGVDIFNSPGGEELLG